MLLDSLPNWIDPEAWQGYVDMRKRIKKPLTARAMTMAIRMLDTLRMQGEDVSMVLMQSEFNSWQGLFAVNEEFRRQIQGESKQSAFMSKISDRTWAH